MAQDPKTPWKSTGLRRLMRAARHQSDGIRHGLAFDPAIRQVALGCLVLVAIALGLQLPPVETVLLILPVLLVLLMEFVNSAIEAVVDRVSADIHPLSKIAKDYASVAVALAVAMVCTSWVVIAGPLLWDWFARALVS